MSAPTHTGLPFDDIRQLVSTMPGPMPRAGDGRGPAVGPPEAARRAGRLEEIAIHLATWQAKGMPTADRPMVAVFAATHGIANGASRLIRAR